MDKKISELILVDQLATTDVLPIVNLGSTKKVTIDQLKTALAPDLTGFELKNNKQNSLTIDGTGIKYPTVDAVNTGIANINTNAVDRITVKLATAINKGQAVYISNADGTNIVVTKASNTSEITSSKVIGLLETTGATNDILNIVKDGLLAGLNTSTALIGDPVWLGTNGDLIYGLANIPFAPAHLVSIGIVTRVNISNGEILVKIQNGFELKEIHDVSVQTPSNEDFLQYENSTSLWKNKQLTTALLRSKLDSLTNVLNADYQILATDKNVVTSVTFTLPRIVTLPLANSVNDGYEIIVADLFGTVTSTNTLTISKNSTDTINGINNVVIATAYGMRRFISNGSNKWTFDGGVVRTSNNLSDIASASIALANLSGQPKLLAANTIMANNTASPANAQELVYKSSSQQVYTGTPVWTGTTAPSGTTTFTYNYIQIGNAVTLKITILYSVAGLALTSVFLPLPTDAPIPLKPTGFTGVLNYLYAANGFALGAVAAAPASGARLYMRSNSANNGFELGGSLPSGAHTAFDITIQYFTS